LNLQDAHWEGGEQELSPLSTAKIGIKTQRLLIARVPNPKAWRWVVRFQLPLSLIGDN
jgi:hypothetical protein